MLPGVLLMDDRFLLDISPKNRNSRHAQKVFNTLQMSIDDSVQSVFQEVKVISFRS
jgi:hypothetical protein